MTVLDMPVDIYNVEYKMYMIESAKVENIKSEITEYFNGKKIISQTMFEYYDNDINKPINLKSTENILPSGGKIKTDYQYAHQTGNQVLIDKNMITIPLEAETKQTINGTTNILSKTKTIFPTTLPNSQTGNLVLPTSVMSYDLQNPTVATTEVNYDQYDSKGNIQQYTTKDGVPVAIVWGYNSTCKIQWY